MKTTSLLIIASLLCSVLLFSFDIQRAFALTFETITTTGTQANDYCGASGIDASGHVWLVCATTSADTGSELATYLQNGTQLAQISLTSNNPQQLAYIFPAFASSETTCIIYASAQVDGFRKYCYSSSTSSITLQGEYIPSGCTVTQDGNFSYDINGLIWFTCAAEDLVMAFNPTTMTNRFTSPDLTDAIGIDCDGPEAIGFDYTSTVVSVGIVVIACDTVDNIVTASIDYSTVPYTFGAFLDEETPASAYGSASDDITLDPFINRIIMSDAGGLDLYTYTNAGIISASTQNVGTASAQNCFIDAFIISDTRIVGCATQSGIIDFFVSNSTGFFHTANYAGFTFILNRQILNTFGTGSLWVAHQGGTNNSIQQFLLIGTSDIEVEPAPPPAETPPNVIGGIDCDLPENANILICRLGGDDNFGGIGNSTGSGLLNIACNVIFVDCTDTNPRTNGLGLLAFIASLFVIVGMFWYAIGKEAFHMPLFIWIVIVVALSAFFTITGWIDPIFLVLTIVAIIAMAVPKVVSITKSGSTMGSGSSE